MIFKKLFPYWRIIFLYPLHFLAAFVSAMISTFLLALQPGFVRVFIDEASRGVSKQHLVTIACFMLFALILAYIFEVIQVAISLEFRINIQRYIRKIHYKYCQYFSSRQNELAIQKGITNLTELTILSSLEFAIVLFSLLMITSFMLFENTVLGIIVLMLLTIGAIINIYLTRPLGKISYFKELSKVRMTDYFQAPNENKYDRLIYIFQKFEHKRFILDSIFIFCSFFIFKVFPAIILIVISLSLKEDIGSIASLFLYFNLLHRPYFRFITLIKQIVLLYSQGQIYRSGIETGFFYEENLTKFPKGIFFASKNNDAGKVINEENTNDCVVYQDDESCKSLEGFFKMINNNMKKPILILTNRKDIYKYGHFYFDENNKLSTVAKYIAQENKII